MKAPSIYIFLKISHVLGWLMTIIGLVTIWFGFTDGHGFFVSPDGVYHFTNGLIKLGTGFCFVVFGFLVVTMMKFLDYFIQSKLS